MRISDWSSDVCSSDLEGRPPRSLTRETGRLSVEPDVLVAEAVVGAVRHRGQVLDMRMETGRRPCMEDHRTSGVLLELLVDLPHQLLALLDVGLGRSEEHTSELQSLMRISYAVFCLKK